MLHRGRGRPERGIWLQGRKDAFAVWNTAVAGTRQWRAVSESRLSRPVAGLATAGVDSALITEIESKGAAALARGIAQEDVLRKSSAGPSVEE